MFKLLRMLLAPMRRINPDCDDCSGSGVIDRGGWVFTCPCRYPSQQTA